MSLRLLLAFPSKVPPSLFPSSAVGTLLCGDLDPGEDTSHWGNKKNYRMRHIHRRLDKGSSPLESNCLAPGDTCV